MTTERKPWHYDALAGRPEWSKLAGVEAAIKRQEQNEIRRAAERKGARHG